MSTSIQLHIATNVHVADAFDMLFQTLQARAAKLLDSPRMLDSTIWELAQYVDLADAGYGKRSTVLYRRANATLGAYVRANFDRRTSRAMFGRSAVLSKLVDKVLAEQQAAFDASSGEVYDFAAA